MGIPFPPFPSTPPAAGAWRRSSAPAAEPPALCPGDAASRTARLMDEFRAHAAEWEAADRAAHPPPPPAPRLTTAGACPGGIDAAFARWRRAAAETRGPGH